MRFLLMAVMVALSGWRGVAQTLLAPAGTRIPLALLDPIWAKSVAPGDVVHFQSVFPVNLGNQVIIPVGTYVDGRIDIVVRPAMFSPYAELRFYFTQMIFADGYVVPLAAPALDEAGVELDGGAANATVRAVVTARNDVLLERGWSVDMLLNQPVVLDAARLGNAARLSKRPQFFSRPASRCVPFPGTPGTPDQVIPGTPPTQPTVIPGGPGIAPTVIPGTPGTPDVVIPGSPGVPARPCPIRPVATSTPSVHKESFKLEQAIREGGVELPAGGYQATWTGLEPVTQVHITGKGQLETSISAQVVAVSQSVPETKASLRANSDGSLSLDLLQFKGRSFGLRIAR